MALVSGLPGASLVDTKHVLVGNVGYELSSPNVLLLIREIVRVGSSPTILILFV
jgi:hypothetical protein